MFRGVVFFGCMEEVFFDMREGGYYVNRRNLRVGEWWRWMDGDKRERERDLKIVRLYLSSKI